MKTNFSLSLFAWLLFCVNTLFIALFRFHLFAFAKEEELPLPLILLDDSELNTSFRRKASRRDGDVCIWKSYVGEGSAPLLQIEPSYFGHPVERFSILPSRAPACHSERKCFRFRRPKGNNPSLRSLDHVEDRRVSFLEYYGFLCTDVHVYCVHSMHSRIYRPNVMYMCGWLDAPLQCKGGVVNESRMAHQRQRATVLLSEIAATKCTKLYRSVQSCVSWACLRRKCISTKITKGELYITAMTDTYTKFCQIILKCTNNMQMNVINFFMKISFYENEVN